jgi:glycosyltransferase
MRILFTTFPWHSHHFPMVPLEWACVAAGHEVRVASAPKLMPMVVDSGLPAVPVGRDLDVAAMSRDRGRVAWHVQRRWPDDWPVHPELLDDDQFALIENLARMQAEIAAEMLDDLLAFGREWRPDLVVHDAVTLAGPVTAAALDVPNVSHLWGTPGLQRIEMRRLGDEPLPEYARLYERVGAPVRTEPTAWIDPCAPGTRYPTGPTCHEMRYVPYNGPGMLPRWLLAERRGPRICVTWGGTSAALLGASVLDLVRQCVDAAAALADDVVVAVTGQAAEILRQTPLPSAVRVEPDLPLHLLLPTCDLVVHHGGAGTSMTAALSALPQLVVTQRPEPTLNGTRLAAAGAARTLLTSDVPAGVDGVRLVRGEIGQLAEDASYRLAAERLRDGIHEQPTPAALVSRLEALAGAGRDGAPWAGGDRRPGAEVRALLWSRPEPAPAPGVPTRDQIARSAVELADRDGLDAVSADRVTELLDVPPGVLGGQLRYSTDLTDLLLDRALSELCLPAAPSGEWRTDLRLMVTSLWDALERHPWLAVLAHARPLFSPHALALVEFGMAVLRGCGLDAYSAALINSMLTGAAYSSMLGRVHEEAAVREFFADTPPEDLHAEAQPFLQRIIDDGRYPFLAEFLRAGSPHAPARDLLLTQVDLVLDGIAARIAGRPAA